MDHEKVQAPETPAKIEREAEVLAKQCAAQAANAGVRLEDIEEEVGDLEELIATKLEDAVEAKKGRSRRTLLILSVGFSASDRCRAAFRPFERSPLRSSTSSSPI